MNQGSNQPSWTNWQTGPKCPKTNLKKSVSLVPESTPLLVG